MLLSIDNRVGASALQLGSMLLHDHFAAAGSLIDGLQYDRPHDRPDWHGRQSRGADRAEWYAAAICLAASAS